MIFPVQFSIITKSKGILTKKYSLSESGKLKKDGKQCFLQHGSVETITCDFSEVPEILDGLKNNQAIIHGIAEESPCTIVSQRLIDKYPDAITRTKDKFKYPDIGLLMFDYDMSDQGLKCNKSELIQHIRSLHPELQNAAMIWRPSASSCITDGKTEYIGIKNQRLYMPYINGEFLEEFTSALELLAWDKGLGHIEISAAGTPLTRCIFDNAVFSPERLDFASGAKCVEPLVQHLPKTQCVDGEFVDLSKVPEVNEGRAKSVMKQAKADRKEDLISAQKKYRKSQENKLVAEHELTNKQAKQVVSARLKNRLVPKDILYSNDMEPIKVADIIASPAEYHHMVVRDPLEPEYGVANSKIYVNDDGITVNSFAHGGRIFMLNFDKELYMEWLETIDKDDLADSWLDNLDKFTGTNVEKEQIVEAVKDKTGISKGVLRQDLKAKETEIQEEHTEQFGDLTHHEIANMMLAVFPKHTVVTEGNLYSYNGSNCWQPKSLDDIKVDIANKFDGMPKCSRGSDYKAIAVHICSLINDDSFFRDVPVGMATKDYYWEIKNGELLKSEHKPEHRIRFILPFNMAGPDYKMPLFMNFLEWCFSQDLEMIKVMQQVFGAIIFGTLNIHHHKAILFKGRGMNGKSVIIDILKSIIPSHYVSGVSPFKFNDPVFAAHMAGKLLNIVSELERNQILPSAAFKSVVDSGVLTGKKLYQQPFQFPATAAQVFSSNWEVKTNDDSYGMQRRWLIFDFKNTVKAKDRVYELGTIIAQNETPEILRWAAEGALMLDREGGFRDTESSETMRKKMFDNVSNINTFISDDDVVEACETGTKSDKNRVFRAGLYDAYLKWGENSGYLKRDMAKKHKFNTFLEDSLGYDLQKTSKGYMWDGLRVIRK